MTVIFEGDIPFVLSGENTLAVQLSDASVIEIIRDNLTSLSAVIEPHIISVGVRTHQTDHSTPEERARYQFASRTLATTPGDFGTGSFGLEYTTIHTVDFSVTHPRSHKRYSVSGTQSSFTKGVAITYNPKVQTAHATPLIFMTASMDAKNQQSGTQEPLISIDERTPLTRFVTEPILKARSDPDESSLTKEDSSKFSRRSSLGCSEDSVDDAENEQEQRKIRHRDKRMSSLEEREEALIRAQEQPAQQASKTRRPS
ncbi:hypothetical protein GMRT_10300 [Giardia muris]|uniref:Uncharacterized protein n=1 Tax=Giardia muris TaxID=5742 RepID=A0A4Z1SYM0_GIAMU|nr:hypothetical protein GMRT_10300 [Giardia muris]|eukprot:TNJ29875.1 hypothetical protein GMRT_10300 [Giardia muris]